MVQLNFDASQVKPYENDTIPAGWYNVVIDNSEMKPTKDGSNAYLELRYSVVDGQYAGRKLFSRHNIQHSNPQTVEIAWQEISAIAHAVGVLRVADTNQLMNIPFKVKVRIRKDKNGEYDDQNDISSYKHMSFVTDQPKAPGAAAPKAGGFVPPAQQPTQQPQNPAGGWDPNQGQQQQPVQQPPQQFAQPPAQQQPPTQQFQTQQPWEQGQQQQPQFTPPVQQQQPPQQFQQPPAQQVQQPPQQHPAQTQTPPWERQG